jgi:hypothetical protein
MNSRYMPPLLPDGRSTRPPTLRPAFSRDM